MNTAFKYNNNINVSNNSKIMFLSETALFCLTLLLWMDRILLTYIRAFIMRLPLIWSMVDYFIIGTYVVLIIFAMPTIFKRIHHSDIVFGFAVIITYLINYIIFPDNTKELTEHMPTFLFMTFPLYYIGIALDFDRIYPWLYKLSLITIAFFTYYKLYVNAPMTEIESLYAGDMWGAYNILPHVCVVSLSMLKKPNIINVLITVIGVFIIASLGSRGPFLCAVMTIAVYLIFFKKYKRPIFAFFIIIIVAVMVILQLDTIMHWLYNLSKEAGLSIRVFEKYFAGSFSDTSSRDVIADRLYERIAANPTFGYGLFSDRVVRKGYAHNIAIELWHSFGVIFGTLLLVGIIYVLIQAAKVVKKIEKYALLYIPLLFAGFVKLFLSNSFLEEIYLYWLLGLSVNLIRNSKHK